MTKKDGKAEVRNPESGEVIRPQWWKAQGQQQDRRATNWLRQLLGGEGGRYHQGAMLRALLAVAAEYTDLAGQRHEHERHAATWLREIVGGQRTYYHQRTKMNALIALAAEYADIEGLKKDEFAKGTALRCCRRWLAACWFPPRRS
jgi:hypothetical protein